jgi:hypothetical protein
MARAAVHQVDGELALSGVKTEDGAVAFAAAVVLVVIGVEADGGDVPNLRSFSADPFHQGDERFGVRLRFFILKQRENILDGRSGMWNVFWFGGLRFFRGSHSLNLHSESFLSHTCAEFPINNGVYKDILYVKRILLSGCISYPLTNRILRAPPKPITRGGPALCGS